MKVDTSSNGELKHRQTRLIPKDKKLIHIPEIRAWLAVPENLTSEQCEAYKADYLRKYAEGLKRTVNYQPLPNEKAEN